MHFFLGSLRGNAIWSSKRICERQNKQGTFSWKKHGQDRFYHKSVFLYNHMVHILALSLFYTQINCVFFSRLEFELLVRIANREDTDQTVFQKQSNVGLHCLSRSFYQATSVQNFRTFIVSNYRMN